MSFEEGSNGWTFKMGKYQTQKEKLMLQEVRYLRNLEKKLQWRQNQELTQKQTESSEMQLQKQKVIICQMIQFSELSKAAGELSNVDYEEITYEGYAPGGVAVIVTALTDNRNRTASEVRHIFDKNGGSLGVTGAVSWMFDKKGLIIVEKTDDIDEEDLMMKALDAGAEDFSAEEDSYEIITDPADFSDVRLTLENQGVPMVSAEITMIPKNTVTVTDEEDIKKINKMLDMFDDNDDVQDVYHNAELPDEE